MKRVRSSEGVIKNIRFRRGGWVEEEDDREL